MNSELGRYSRKIIHLSLADNRLKGKNEIFNGISKLEIKDSQLKIKLSISGLKLKEFYYYDVYVVSKNEGIDHIKIGSLNKKRSKNSYAFTLEENDELKYENIVGVIIKDQDKIIVKGYSESKSISSESYTQKSIKKGKSGDKDKKDKGNVDNSHNIFNLSDNIDTVNKGQDTLKVAAKDIETNLENIDKIEKNKKEHNTVNIENKNKKEHDVVSIENKNKEEHDVVSIENTDEEKHKTVSIENTDEEEHDTVSIENTDKVKHKTVNIENINKIDNKESVEKGTEMNDISNVSEIVDTLNVIEKSNTEGVENLTNISSVEKIKNINDSINKEKVVENDKLSIKEEKLKSNKLDNKVKNIFSNKVFLYENKECNVLKTIDNEKQTVIEKDNNSNKEKIETKKVNHSHKSKNNQREKFEELYKNHKISNPFGKKKNYDCIEISIVDIVFLPMFKSYIKQNPFIVHNYVIHKHLLLIHNKDTNKYYIGIPDNQNQYYSQVGKLYGLSEFEKTVPSGMVYGYWFINV